MNSIERFNNQLNQRTYLENEEMDQFNLQIELSLRSSFSRLNNKKKILLIGAGNLREISLLFLLRFFNEMVVTDIDVDSINNAIEREKLSSVTKKRIDVRKIEYTGFDSIGFFNRFRTQVITSRSEKEIIKILDGLVSEVTDYTFINETFDFIYVSPIYTQLVMNQLLGEIELLRSNGYPVHLCEFIKMYMLDKIQEIIDRFNKTLVESLEVDGEMMVLSDILQLDLNSEFYRRVKFGIKEKIVMDEIYESYVMKHGMGIGDFGLFNLDDKISRLSSKWLLWPFDESRSFAVKLNLYKKRMEEKL